MNVQLTSRTIDAVVTLLQQHVQTLKTWKKTFTGDEPFSEEYRKNIQHEIDTFEDALLALYGAGN